MKRLIALFLCLSALLATCATAAFGHEAPDFTKKGSITIQWKYQETVVPDGALRAYRIAAVKEDDGDFTFLPLAGFGGKKFTADSLTPELAKELAGMVKSTAAIAPTSSKDGVVTFEKLQLGLYLIVQTRSAAGYQDISPFLVSVPMWDTDHYVYEINAKEKFQLKKTTDSTQKPDTDDKNNSSGGTGGGSSSGGTSTGGSSSGGNTLPQTGQLNWPIPVLLLGGTVLIVGGVALRRREYHA